MTSLRGQERKEFPAAVKRSAFRRCCQKDGKPRCENCGNVLRSGGIVFEHIQADGLGGEPTLGNCKVHCSVCADAKTFTEDNPRMAKADRVLRKTYGLAPRGKKLQSRGFGKAPAQRTASRPVVRRASMEQT